jgi:hypothetical protein
MTAKQTGGKSAMAEALDKMRNELAQISFKIDRVIDMEEKILRIVAEPKGEQEKGAVELGALDVMTLLSLPDHLRKSAMVICKMGEATANDVSKETGRARAVESGYLNQLVTMGHLKRRRKGRKVYFYVEK